MESIFIKLSENVYSIGIYTIECLSYNENTVKSPLTDTPVSGQLYLRAPSQIPVLPPSQTLYLHIPLNGQSLVSGRGHF